MVITDLGLRRSVKNELVISAIKIESRTFFCFLLLRRISCGDRTAKYNKEVNDILMEPQAVSPFEPLRPGDIDIYSRFDLQHSNTPNRSSTDY